MDSIHAFRAAVAIFTFCVCGLTAEPPRLPDFSKRTGVIELPAGTIVLHRELTLSEAAHDLEIRGNPAGSTLQAAPDFQGRALIYSKGATDLRFTGFHIEGNRTASPKAVGLPEADTPFAHYYRNNGIVVDGASQLAIRDLTFKEIANYPIVVSASSGVHIENLKIEDSGLLTPKGQNNASGGILLEEGTSDFEVARCILRRVRGNGIWTHSFYHSPRNVNGTIEGNDIEEVARDAIQVGHAAHVVVRGNKGRRIGFPADLVDIASWAVPVAITPRATWIIPAISTIISKTSTGNASTWMDSTTARCATIRASAARRLRSIPGRSSESCSTIPIPTWSRTTSR